MVCASWVVWDVGSYDHVALGFRARYVCPEFWWSGHPARDIACLGLP